MNYYNKAIKLIIADEQFLIRKACTNLVNDYLSRPVIYEARSGSEVLNILSNDHYHLLIMHIDLPMFNGIDAVRDLVRNYPFTKLLIMMDKSRMNFKELLKMGTVGLITKNSSEQEFYSALKAVVNGEKYIASDLQNQALNNLLNEQDEYLQSLISKRELEIIKLISEGNSSKEIGDKLFISVKTVESHRRKIYKKLKVKNVASLLEVVNTTHILSSRYN